MMSILVLYNAQIAALATRRTDRGAHCRNWLATCFPNLRNRKGGVPPRGGVCDLCLHFAINLLVLSMMHELRVT